MVDHAAFFQYPLKHPEKDRHARAPEPVNRLFRIADDHQLPRSKAAGHIRIFGKQRNDLGLYVVGILEFIDEQRLKLSLVVLSNWGVILEQIAGADQEVIEVHCIESSLLRAESFRGKSDEPRQMPGNGNAGDLTDSRKEGRGVVPLAERMPGLPGV